MCGEAANPRGPVGELVVRVEVRPAAAAAAVRAVAPARRVAAVHADHRDVARRRDDRRDRRDEALRLVDADVDEVVVREEVERLAAIGFGHPGLVAQLDRDAERGEAVANAAELRLVRRRDREPHRELEQHDAELAGVVERGERIAKPPGQLAHDLDADVPGIDVRLLDDVAGQPLAHLARQPAHARVVLRQERVRLDVHREAVGRAPGPRRDPVGIGKRPVRRVVLDDRELRRVVAKLGLGAAHVLGIPAALDEHAVRPGCRTDLDLRRHENGACEPRARRQPRGIRR